ncbi:MAG: hypothetical protein JNL82_37320 [Myxococcales bacterium]|nr:hypothetical protein [Myxococcales bacterium]
MASVLTLALLLALEPPRSLSPEAGEHNTVAMQHYDAGEFGPAVDEFYAAYQAMPDARLYREGRVLLLGSMRATLLALHKQTGEPAPLCRLQKILKEHLDALTAAYPEDPEMLEARSVRARLGEVTQQLAAIGPTACEPPPPVPAPVVAADPTPPPSTEPATPPAPSPPKAATPPSPDAIPPRQLKIAGGVTLGLGGVLLGVMTYGIIAEASARAGALEIHDKPPGCPLTPTEYTELQNLQSDARTGRGIAIGTGIAAGVTAVLGGTLLGLARRSARAKRWSAMPWWSPTGAGLALHVRLGAAR